MDNQPISPLISQMFLTKAGLFCSERLSTDIVYLNQCIDLLLPTFNLKELEKEYDEKYGVKKWDEVILKKQKLVKRLAETKTWYDAIQDKSLMKRPSTNNIMDDIQKMFRRFFYKTSSKIFLIEKDMYRLFVFLVMNSNVQRMQIKNEYFKNLEQKDNRQIKMDRNPPRSS